MSEEKIAKIIYYIKNRINNENMESTVDEILEKLEAKGNKEIVAEAEEHISFYPKYKFFHIGESNRGGYLSAIPSFLPKDLRIMVASSIYGEGYISAGNNKEPYEMLIRKIQGKEDISFEDMINAVYGTTIDYFGKIEDVNESRRIEYYMTLAETDACGRLEDFRNSGMAACAERAILSHNLMQLLGINSTLKVSQIIINGKVDSHYYNLISHDGKYYIYDSTIPRIREDGSVSPLITEIPEEVYNQLNHPRENEEAVKVTFPSIRGNREIVYNSRGKEIYDADGVQEKTPEVEDHVGEL